MRTIATAKVQRNYNCYNVYFNECLPLITLFGINADSKNIVIIEAL